MERLLEDASELSGIEYDIENLADVYNAIHVIQTNLGVTGTTAEEAATTLSGSMASMKASVTNLLGALTTGGDVKSALSALAQTLGTFVKNNLLPMIGNLLSSLPEVIPDLLQMVINALQFTGDKVDQVVKSGMSIVKSLVDGIIGALPSLARALGDVVISMSEALTDPDSIVMIFDTAVALLLALADGIIDAIPRLIEAMPQVLSNIVSALIKLAPELVKAANAIVGKLGDGIVAARDSLKKSLSNLWTMVTNWIKNLDVVKIGKDMIDGLIQGIKSQASALGDSIKSAASGALDSVKNFLGIHSPSTVMRDQVGKYIPEGIAEGISGNTQPVTSAMNDLANKTTGTISGQLQSTVSSNASVQSRQVSSGVSASGSDLYALVARYLPAIAAGGNVNVTLEGDVKKLFTAMRRESVAYSARTGIATY